ncbi:NADH-FMN oxidoreductase RutF, flavin reductase (DIM6/NTAB) family [Micromonospora siamensis]|uniref:NADH-FMN oxidoreductase RutF, flavin reductase (DIM6/NTAB) family n=1 Tax=Micromonospora siamensis TaxID=299152 RepID=A0A1C5GU37_9ACTN|nr:NADH-FMN oxidoreductase RutF, flavin reductase (DIM6/NTAB) family [Micromonospora siamensis]
MRPLWRCRACGAEWPCQPALLVEYRGDRTGLLIYLGALLAEAGDQLAQLNGHARPDGLHERFLGWARARGGTMFHVNHEPGAEIHHTDPFAVPSGQRSPVRRLRGRLAAPVTLWTAPGPAGLTVSSTLVAEGEPDRLLGLVDAESDLWAAIEAAGRFAVAPLGPPHRQLADRFAGLFPSPGGLFATGPWTDTDYGPVPTDAGGWAGCRLDTAREYGWALLVEATIETVDLAEETAPLLHYRGRYHDLT